MTGRFLILVAAAFVAGCTLYVDATPPSAADEVCVEVAAVRSLIPAEADLAAVGSAFSRMLPRTTFTFRVVLPPPGTEITSVWSYWRVEKFERTCFVVPTTPEAAVVRTSVLPGRMEKQHVVGLSWARGTITLLPEARGKLPMLPIWVHEFGHHLGLEHCACDVKGCVMAAVAPPESASWFCRECWSDLVELRRR